MARRALIAAVAALGATALWAWTRGTAPPGAVPRPTAEVIRAPATMDAERRDAIAETVRRVAAAASRAVPPPGSLRDTEVDGALTVDADGRLQVTPELRRFFEYFLIASGEEPTERIRARIEDEIRRRLQGDAQRTALDLLDRYVAYRERGRALAAARADDDLDARYDTLRRLRRDSFGEADATALFSDDEAAYAIAVEQRRVAADPALSDDEREARIAALDLLFPEPQRAARAAVTAPLRLAREESALRAAGGSPEEIQALRERNVGSEAAERLAALDQRRAEWQGRVDAYRAECAAVGADTSLTSEQREVALETLRARHFSVAELPRIRALDRLQEAAAPPP